MLATPSEGGSSPPGRSPMILVVEDEEMVGEVVQAMLHMGGFRSVHAKGPEEALQILGENRLGFDLLLTDFRMPGMTGIELIQRFKAVRPELRTILYSGNADPSATARFPIQPDHFLLKPFTPKTLNDLIRRTLATPPDGAPQGSPPPPGEGPGPQ